ncbi:MAG: glycosyltransferase [Dysgonamonadaceae bacterium]|jgi:glycosyltransferase involved in cell wall biosynthesis|nr:glycosyltransferase [Dysgonamonadaceae bacterium]
MTDSNTRISIAMATYNGERYLRQQLDSILRHTHSNFELVICDDCSTTTSKRCLQLLATSNISREFFSKQKKVYLCKSILNYV